MFKIKVNENFECDDAWVDMRVELNQIDFRFRLIDY